MSFGEILKKIREDNNLTQEELAKKVNTSRSNIANYENNKNKPSVEVLEKLSLLFNVSIDYLLGKTTIKNTEHFEISFNKETEGLSDEDIKEALRIYKQIKYGKKGQKNDWY